MKQVIKHLLCLCCTVMFMSISAFAQVTTSSIAGKVTDNDGPVAGAAVIATHVSSGTNYYSVTDKNGAYRVNAVTPGGPYEIRVEMLGYRTIQYNNVYAPLGEVLTLNATLEVEALGLEAAVFTADGVDSGMNINNAGVGTSVSQKTMNALPTVNRSMTDVMMLTPQSSSNSNGTSLGGGNYRSSFVSVDGAAFQNSFGIGSNLPAGGSPISLDALEQLTVDITPFDVRHSGFTGGAINAVTKSGTNQWHASLYNYYKSDQLTGDRVVDEKMTLSKSFSNVTGVTVGGPIIKNKLFFFVNAEYSPETVPSTKEATPTGSEWKKGGVYSRPTVGFMDDVSKYLKDTYQYDPGPYQNYSVAAPDWKVMARVDWNINDSHRLNVRFNHTANMSSSSPSSSVNPMPSPSDNMYDRKNYGRVSDYAMYFQGTNYQTLQQFTSLSAELNSRFLNGNINNMLRFTWSHQNEERQHTSSVFPSVDILEPLADGTKAVLTSFGLDPFTLGNLRDVQTITVTDEVNITKGINNITAGLQFEWDETKNGYLQMGAGYYLYNSWEDFKANAKPAAFAITHPNTNGLEMTYPSFQYMQASAYVQDELNISDYFKLTAGIRFELPFYPSLKDNHNNEFETLAATSQSFKGMNTDDLPAARLSVSPRVGFNWDILKNRSLILRGGTGIYTGRIPFVWIVSAVGNSNCIQAQYYDVKGQTDVGFHTNVKDIVNDLYDLGGAAYVPKTDLPAPQGATILDKNLKLPSTWKTSLALEGRLPGGIKATLEGIYNKDLTSVYVRKLGFVQNETGLQLPGEPSQRASWKSEKIMNSAGGEVVPYYLTNSDVNGYYYSVTAQLQKDFNFGLSAMAAYTYSDSQSLNEGYGDQVSSAFSANNYSINGSNIAALGHSGFVAPHRAIANISYSIKQGNRGKSTFGLFYEGMNLCFIGDYSYNRMSYVMNDVTGVKGAKNLIYIPTTEQLAAMPFSSDENRNAYEAFIKDDAYLSKHRGEYAERGGVTVPWVHHFNFKFTQDINFMVAGREQTIQLGFDINNIGNLLNSKWGVAKKVDTEEIIKWDSATQQYTFKAPTWTVATTTYSTWSMLLSLRWFF